MSTDFSKSFYEASVARASYPVHSGRTDTRVCILGGGLAGLSTALGLAERGVTDVVVLESQQVGHGASGRNGGLYSAATAWATRTCCPPWAPPKHAGCTS